MTRTAAELRQERGELALLATSEMYEADRLAIAGGVAGMDLMEAAGRAVAEALVARRPPCRVLVLCGPGNNGGDGFVAARLLAEQGWDVRVALLGARDRLKGDAAHHAGLWPGAVEELEPGCLAGADVVVDALFGAGLARPLEGAVRDTVQELAGRRVPVHAVDMPSGVSGDSGEVLGALAVRAEVTVTFFRRKPGHLLLPGAEYCGEVVTADIGIPGDVLDRIRPGTHQNDPALWLARYPWRRPRSHKYDFGHAVVVAGEVLTGAAHLAARAAQRVGAGLVTVAAAPATVAVFASASPSLMVAPLGEASDFTDLLADRRKNVFLIGPGNGLNPATRDNSLAALAAGKAVVLDADALTVFQDAPRDLFAAIRGPTVLTPHEGEFARLFPEPAEGKLARARQAARLSGAVILLKGADTVVAAPDGAAAVNRNAPPWLAVAGAGDVLAGLVAGLLAQGMEPFDAACAAAWLHGETASICGPGLISEDLPPLLPQVLRALYRRRAGFA
jgi:NAD(P)H-hydrate epimerase